MKKIFPFAILSFFLAVGLASISNESASANVRGFSNCSYQFRTETLSQDAYENSGLANFNGWEQGMVDNEILYVDIPNHQDANCPLDRKLYLINPFAESGTPRSFYDNDDGSYFFYNLGTGSVLTIDGSYLDDENNAVIGAVNSTGTRITVNSPAIVTSYLVTIGADAPSGSSSFVEGLEETVGVVDDDSQGVGSDRTCADTSGAFNWLICPVITGLSGSLTFIDRQINDLLSIDPDRYNNQQVEAAWSAARNIAYMLLVPAMLVMVIGTALGFEFVSAYTVKKALPRMVAAAIFIAFSLDIGILTINIIDAIGNGAKGIITGAMDAPDELAAYLTPGQGAVAEGIMIGGGLIYVVTQLTGTGTLEPFLWTLMGILITVVIVILIAYAVLILRQILIIGLLLLAPLAIIGWIFPANTKLWTIWRTTFIKLLLMYPLIMIVLGVGRGLAALVSPVAGGEAVTGGGAEGLLSPIFIILAYALPYVFIPFAFKFVGGTIGRLGGMLNNVEGGWLKKVSKRGRDARAIAKAPRENQWQGKLQRQAGNKQYINELGKQRRRAERRVNQANSPDERAAAQAQLDSLNADYQTAQSDYNPGITGRRNYFEERGADLAVLKAEATKNRADVRGDYATKQAAEIEVQAATINAQNLYEEHFDRNIAAGQDGATARENSLSSVRESLERGLRDGTANQAQMTGTMQFLGGQKAVGELNQLSDAIHNMGEGPEAVAARQMYGGALGNSATFGAVTGASPGLKNVPTPARDEQGNVTMTMPQQRADRFLSNSTSTVAIAGAERDAWTEAFEQNRERAEERLADVLEVGGEVSANLKVSPQQRQQAEQVLRARQTQQTQQQPPQTPPPSPPTDGQRGTPGYM